VLLAITVLLAAAEGKSVLSIASHRSLPTLTLLW